MAQEIHNTNRMNQKNGTGSAARWCCVSLTEIPEINGTRLCISDLGKLECDTKVLIAFRKNQKPMVGRVVFSTEDADSLSAQVSADTPHITDVISESCFEAVLSAQREAAQRTQLYERLCRVLRSLQAERSAQLDKIRTILQSVQTQREAEKRQSPAESSPVRRPTPPDKMQKPLEGSMRLAPSEPASTAMRAGQPASGDQTEKPGLPTLTDEEFERTTEAWMAQLLDTGKRNRMINYRETRRSTLRVLDPEAATLFNQLAISEKTLKFQKPINKDTDLRTYSMIALMETLSYTLNVQVGDIRTAGTVIEREKTLKNLRAKAKLAQEEQGANILYLCFGFIYWRENNRSSTPLLKAPLLLMPVTIGQKSLNAPFTLSRYEDEITVNPTLDYLFRTEYKFELPPFELKNKASIEDYFAQVAELVDKRGWRLAREVSLGLLSFLKISMYHDLAANRARLREHPVLRAMAGDNTAIGELPADLEHFNRDELKPEQWHEVVDADSSQEEAIHLSKLGVSFVMQGPPGTGKSQTITNIIAEALADGKKILFVSEKAAALEVVLKRLTEAHLDDFCLSLHNYRANKREIVYSISANLDLAAEYVDDSALSDLTELFHDTRFLNQYAEELHRALPPLGLCAYTAFGRLCGLQDATAVEFHLDNVTELQKTDFAAMQYSVSTFEKALHALGGPLSGNPWRNTKTTSAGQVFRSAFLQQTAGLPAALRRIGDQAEKLDAVLRTGSHSRFADVKKLLFLAEILQNKPALLRREWLLNNAGQETAEAATAHAQILRKQKIALTNEWKPSILFRDPEQLLGSLRSDLGGGTQSVVSQLAGMQTKAETLRSRIEVLVNAYREGTQLLCWDQPDRPDHIRTASEVLKLIADAPDLEASWFNLRKNAEILTLAEEASRQSNYIEDLTNQILRDWEPAALELDAAAMLGRFKADYVGLFKTLKPGYKEDIRTLRMLSRKVGVRLDDDVISGLLSKIILLQQQKAWFSERQIMLRQAIGMRYDGEKTNWSKVKSGLKKAQEIVRLFPYGTITDRTVSALLQITNSPYKSCEARRIASCIAPERVAEVEAELRSTDYLSNDSVISDLTGTVLPQIRTFLDRCAAERRYAEELEREKKGGNLTGSDLDKLAEGLAVLLREETWFRQYETELRELAGDSYDAENTDWEAIIRSFDTADRLRRMFSGTVPEQIIEAACTPDAIRLLPGRDEIDELRRLMEETEPKLAAFSAVFDYTDFRAVDFSAAAERYEACVNGFEELHRWLDYKETRAACDAIGLAPFTAAIAELDNAVDDVRDAFERGFYVQWLAHQLDRIPAVQTFRRRIHEQRAERFAQLDTAQYEIARKRIRDRIISTYPNLNRVTRAGSELQILNREKNKKIRHIPLRRLFKSIPNLLLTLKPCLMMSPLSVAYFLDADLYKFDLVIFDEASQIFPEDAVGSIFRGRQVIIAGDTKQLPPTNFFTANTSGETLDGYDAEEGYDEMIYDSILEQTADVLPNRMLRWHYRSKHEHLIAFSNREIYRNDLVTFPSSNESQPDTGVEFVYVEDGCYEPAPRNCNVPEARRIADLVREHIERHPERSLGVIAFSEKQQQAITLEIQRFREQNQKYEAFFAEGKEDEFFVKNLENVQGDERDTIIFSVGYARTREQRERNRPMSMRFGPLGVAGGERRLNVAITRAKVNVKLVSSILPSDIDLSRTDSAGVRMLRSYIEFAQSRGAAVSASGKAGRPDEFVDAIADFLASSGFRVQKHVGCSSCKIDVAVRHPSETVERYVAGIECDGYSYVSARTARDRERLRGSVLRSMGWNLYRVWSAEWYKDPETEGKHLIEFIQKAIELADADPRDRGRGVKALPKS